MQCVSTFPLGSLFCYTVKRNASCRLDNCAWNETGAGKNFEKRQRKKTHWSRHVAFSWTVLLQRPCLPQMLWDSRGKKNVSYDQQHDQRSHSGKKQSACEDVVNMALSSISLFNRIWWGFKTLMVKATSQVLFWDSFNYHLKAFTVWITTNWKILQEFWKISLQ